MNMKKGGMKKRVIVGYSGFDENPGEEYLGEEELEESEHDSAQKTKQDLTPLWKYVIRHEARKGGGTTKFHCPHCNNNYTGSYTRARKHLCGKRPWNGDKQTGIKTCTGVSAVKRTKYIREEEEAQYKSKRSNGFFEPSSQSHPQKTPSTSSYGSGYGGTRSPNISLRRRTISDFLDEGCKNDVDSKVYRFLYACGIPFNVLRSPYWHEMVFAINDAPKGYRSPRYDKARTIGLDHEKEKISLSLSRMALSWTEHGVSIVSDGWTNVKGKPLISVFDVSVSGAILLSAYDYSNKFKTGINIAEPLLETIDHIGPYNVIQVITDNVANCKAAGAIIEDKYPNTFRPGCLVHIMNLLMHDIIKNKNQQYKWIGGLYKRGKKMIKFITNHSNTHGLFRNHSRLELLKIAKTRFVSYYLTFRRLLKVRESLASMVSSPHWQILKGRATNAADRQGFERVEEIALDGQFWTRVRQVLEFIKPIYHMICFADTNKPVIGEVWNKHNVPLHALAYILTPKYYSPTWLGQPAPGGGVRVKPHMDPEVATGYMEALDKLVPDREECANLRLELGRYFSCTERCWSTYSFIHNVKRNRLNENLAESLVYVHYNLRLLSHYCDWAYEDPTYKIWDNHLEDDNLEDGTIHLEELEAEHMREEDEATTMPPPPSSSSARVPSLAPLLSSPPCTSSRGGHTPFGSGRGTVQEETPRRPRRPAQKLDIICGGKKNM
eukprot:PITA_36712